MQVEIIQGGRVLRRIHHNGQDYLEAPEPAASGGEYEIRLTNNSPNQRCAIVSVDGVNVVDGKDASYDGSGYVLGAWQTTVIKGFLRSGSECARFTFSASEGSLAAQTGRGTKNTGVIGVAVFDEKPKPVIFQPPPVIHHHHHYPRPHHHQFWWGPTFGTTTRGMTSTSHTGRSIDEGVGTLCSEIGESSVNGSFGTQQVNASFDTQQVDALKAAPATSAIDLGTAYGRAERFYTSKVEFERATATPALVITLRYGVTAKLREWGVPVDVAPAHVSPQAPNPFPAAHGYVQPPAGWRG